MTNTFLRRVVIVLATGATIAGLLAGVGSAAATKGGCPSAYTKVTAADPDLSPGLFDAVNKNGDEFICKQNNTSNAASAKFGPNYIDNNAAAH